MLKKLEKLGTTGLLKNLSAAGGTFPQHPGVALAETDRSVSVSIISIKYLRFFFSQLHKKAVLSGLVDEGKAL